MSSCISGWLAERQLLDNQADIALDTPFDIVPEMH